MTTRKPRNAGSITPAGYRGPGRPGTSWPRKEEADAGSRVRDRSRGAEGVVVVAYDTSRVARRSDPERVFTARRMAVRNVLAGEGMAQETADAWCDAWQDEAERQDLDRGSPDYWKGAAYWIAAQRKTRKLPI
jgi:hypothetical protein